MTTLREAAQQALEALEEWHGAYPHRVEEDDIEVAEALRAALAEDAMQKFTDVNQELEAALAEPVQEPVAWMVYTLDGKSVCVTDNPADFIEWRSLPLYTAPPQRKPLDDLAIADIYAKWDATPGISMADFARAIERAHNITGDNT